MQEFYGNTLCNDVPVVLGKTLRPLTLAHVYTLLAAESPYVCDKPDSEKKTLFDLAFAVAVCSRTWEEIGELLANRDTREIEAWGRQWGKAWNTRIDPFIEDEKMVQYLDRYTALPERKRKHKNAPDSGSRNPWPLILVSKYKGELGESRAWNLPVSLAFAYWLADCERDGDDSLVSDAEAAGLARAREIRKKMEMEAAKKVEAAA